MQPGESPPSGSGPGSDSDPECFINEPDGLPNVHPELAMLRQHGDGRADGDDEDEALAELPRTLIVTGIPREVFESEELKAELEELFRKGGGPGGEDAEFRWLKSFSRLRVYYGKSAAAARARVSLHRHPFRGGAVSCYFAQPVTPAGAPSLEPPAPVKQFLISPPASPPVGWEPCTEHEPVVNEELLAALRALAPGEGHELLPSVGDQPAIVIHPDERTQAEGASSRGEAPAQ